MDDAFGRFPAVSDNDPPIYRTLIAKFGPPATLGRIENGVYIEGGARRIQSSWLSVRG